MAEINLYDGIEIAKEQPSQEIGRIDFKAAKPFFMKGSLKQLQFANMACTDMNILKMYNGI